MRSREILLVVLVVAIALISGLVGLILGRSSVQPQQAAAPVTVGGGVQVASGTTRLFSDPQKSNLAFEIEAGRVYQGAVQQGQTILFFDGTTIFRGASSAGEKLFTISGDRVFVGGNTNGPIAYTVARGRVFEGTDKGPIIYTIEGERMFAGANTTGNIVFQANQQLSGNIQFLLPVLADRRF